MLIDCDTCTIRGAACSQCMVSTLFETGGHGGGLTAAEQRAIEVFARAGFQVDVIEEPAPAPRPALRVSRPRRRRRLTA